MQELSKSIKQITILVIDDEKHINNALVNFVRMLGYRVISAFDGEEGLQRVIGEKPDLVLLDVIMPKKNGYEVCRIIREREDTRHILVIMLTSLSDRSDRIMGIDAGCDEFAQKPVSFEELKVRIKSLLRINYYRSMLNEKEKFELIVRSVHDGIFVLDHSFKVTEANPFGLRLLNLTPLSVQGLDIIEYIKDNFIVDLSVNLKEPAGNEDVVFEITRPETDTVQGFFLFAGMRYLYDPEGNLCSVILTVWDVTDIKKEELIKRNFISLISHKLLTPLTVILGNQQLLKEKGYENLDDFQKRLITQMLKKTEQLNHLIQKLLIFVEVYSGSFNGIKEQIDFNVFVSKAIKSYFKDLEKDNVCFDISMIGDCVTVPMVPRHLSLIIDNLLDNSIKHNDKKNISINITLDASCHNGRTCAVITVEDNGSGIPQEEYSNIFNTFYQVEKFFTGQKEGFGLGLAMVKQIVEQSGGSIEVTSRINQGSIFQVRLPCQ